MSSSEMDKTPKEESKTPPPTLQESSSTTSAGTINPDWSSFQAYSPMPPHGFLASSPQAHPYMWGVQHIMPPYGTPPHPYVAMYPHGGIYAHPSMPPGSYPFSPFAMPSNGIAEASGNTTGSMEADVVKPPEAKEKLPIKRSKGSLGSLNMITGKNNEHSKITGTSANGIHSKSGESASEGTSEGSDANSQNDSQLKSGGRQDSYEEEPSQNGSSAHASQNGGLNAPQTAVNQTMSVVPISVGGSPGALPGPTTNLNIGMDYWGAPASASIPELCGKVPSTAVAGGMDERELKRQRRKQSNREFARRSRLRKQAECDELAQHAVLDDNCVWFRVTFKPTNKHCSMTTLIGLCILVKLMRSLPKRYKVDIRLLPGSHATEAAVNKQLNDKERVAGALENQAIVDMIEECLAPSYE